MKDDRLPFILVKKSGKNIFRTRTQTEVDVIMHPSKNINYKGKLPLNL